MQAGHVRGAREERMNKRVAGCLIALGLVLWTGPSAHAKDMRGRLGLGLEQSLSGVSGVALRYWMGEAFGLHAVVGAEVLRTGSDGDAASDLHPRLGASVGGIFNVGRSLHANIGVGARAVLGFQSVLAGDGAADTSDKTTLQVGIEIPIMLEFFLSDAFSFSVGTGFRLLLGPIVGDEPILHPPSSSFTQGSRDTLIGIGAGSLLGTLGAVYYF
jgi:hypothetical protein